MLLLIVASEAQAARVEIILDASGSMRASAGAMSRMEAGKRAVRTTVPALAPLAAACAVPVRRRARR